VPESSVGKGVSLTGSNGLQAYMRHSRSTFFLLSECQWQLDVPLTGTADKFLDIEGEMSRHIGSVNEHYQSPCQYGQTPSRSLRLPTFWLPVYYTATSVINPTSTAVSRQQLLLSQLHLQRYLTWPPRGVVTQYRLS